jgi:hypothetical protein
VPLALPMLKRGDCRGFQNIEIVDRLSLSELPILNIVR